MARRRVAVLISGGGSNLQALIDQRRGPAPCAAIALVVSNEPGRLRARARPACRHPDRVVDHRDFADRARVRGGARRGAASAADVELVCLAGFMRILTAGLRRRAGATGCSTSTRRCCPPSPACTPTRRALAAGVRVHGCTVHLVRAGARRRPDPGPGRRAGAAPGTTPRRLAAPRARGGASLLPAWRCAGGRFRRPQNRRMARIAVFRPPPDPASAPRNGSPISRRSRSRRRRTRSRSPRSRRCPSRAPSWPRCSRRSPCGSCRRRRWPGWWRP